MNTLIPINEKRAQALAAGSSLLKQPNPLTGSSLGYLDNSINLNGMTSANFNLIGTQRERDFGSLLVDTTVTVSKSQKQKRSDYRRQKYELLQAIKRILADMNLRVAGCMKSLGDTSIVREKSGRVHSTNLMLCGSIWLCPVCSSRITEQRREELDRAVKNNPDLVPVLVTFTLQHSKEDKLSKLLDRLNRTLQKMKAGYSWKKFQSTYGIKAYASSLEITFSKENGWHPHKHLLFFVEKGADLKGFEKDITERYLHILEKEGGYGSEFHAVDVRSGTATASTYVSKWGITSEFAKSNLKKGRGESYSVWELALLAETDPLFFVKYREYAEATYRKKAITWSKGAHELLGIGKEETDEEIALKETETEPEAEVIATLSPKLWNNIVYNAQQEDAYEACEVGGAELLWEWIRAQRLPVLRKGNYFLWID